MNLNRSSGLFGCCEREEIRRQYSDGLFSAWFFYVLLLVVLFPAIVHARYGGGSGSQTDPYLISTAAHFAQIGHNPVDWNMHFKLMNDIDISDYNGLGGREPFAIIGYLQWEPYESMPFRGVFDGNAKKIMNLTISANGRDFVGLFGYVQGTTACIKNLILVKPKIEAAAAMYVGAIAGRLRMGIIANCSVQQGIISGGDCTGGLVGCSEKAGIINCHTEANIKGKTDVGGVTGYHSGVKMKGCGFTGTVSGKNDVGGLAGESDGYIENCYAIADVHADSDKAAGLIGTLRGQVINSFAKGQATGGNEVGGLVGRNTGKVSDSYSQMIVYGNNNFGGLVGLLYSEGTISRCYAVPDANSGEGMQLMGWGDAQAVEASFWPTNEAELIKMMSQNTYIEAGWDFAGEDNDVNQGVWVINDGNDFPHLAWEGWAKGDFLYPLGVDIYDIIALFDNWLLKSNEVVTADVNDDGIVNFFDLNLLASAWKTKTGQPKWNPKCDIWPYGGDGVVDVRDLEALSEQWLQPGPVLYDIAPQGGDGIVNFLDFSVSAGNYHKQN